MSNQSILNALKEIWINAKDICGWNILEEKDYLALKSPALIPNLNLFLPNKPVRAQDFCKNFFIGSPYGIIYKERWIGDYTDSAKYTVPITEMHLDVPADLVMVEDDLVSQVKTLSELEQWCEAAAKIYGFNSDEMMKFMKEVLPQSQAKLFCIKQQDQIVSIGQIYVDSTKLVYIATIGTLEEFRNRGYGTKIMNECLRQGKLMDGRIYALHASEMGEKLYKNLSFKEVEVWQYSVF